MSKLQWTDLDVLRKILFPEITDWLVYAPGEIGEIEQEERICQTEDDLRCREQELEEYVLFNLSRQPIQRAKASVVVASGPRKGAYQLSYLCNTDGSIRWLYPSDNRSAYFLHLYSATGWRGNLLKRILKWGHGLGLGALLRHGVLSITIPEGQWRPSHLVSRDHTYAIFTGTKGENRKAVVAAGRDEKPDFFLKIPLTAAAQQLVSSEAEHLLALEKKPLTKWVIPQVRILGGALRLSNVQPSNTDSKSHLGPTHFLALQELWGRSKRQLLGDAESYQRINLALDTLQTLADHPEINCEHVAKIRHILKEEFRTLPKDTRWYMGLAHGDFTPWNMFTSRHRLHVFDWELARYEPIGFDLFHFVLQSGCLIHRQTAQQIMVEVEKVCKHAIWEDYPACSPREYWRYYLLRHISYYLPLYLQQSQLHEQVHWQVALWHDLLLLVEA